MRSRVVNGIIGFISLSIFFLIMLLLMSSAS